MEKRCRSRKNLDRELQIYFINTDTSPETARILRYGIFSWLDNKNTEETTTLVENASTALQEAAISQEKIGWKNLFKGRLSNKWGDVRNTMSCILGVR